MDQQKIITTQAIEDVVNKSSSDRVPIRDLIDAANSLGFGLVMMIFSLGIVVPLPPPFPSIIAIPLMIFSSQMVLGYSAPKLPKRFCDLSVKRSILATLVQKSSPYIYKIERILRPRLLFMTTAISERIVGFFALVFSCFVLIPIPFSNLVPGLGVLVISFGLIGKDGIIIIFGIMLGIIGVIISIITILLGAGVVHYIKNLLFI